MNRLILLVESRIRGDVYVRFGGELPKTHRSNTAGRWMLSLLGSLNYFHKRKIRFNLNCKYKIYTKVTIFIIIKIRHYLILSESGNILLGCSCILLQFLLLSTTSIPNYIASLKKR